MGVSAALTRWRITPAPSSETRGAETENAKAGGDVGIGAARAWADVDLTRPTAILLGTEHHGLSDALLAAAEGIPSSDGRPARIAYKRRLGGWLLWRAGPAKGVARYMAIHADDLDRHLTFRLHADGTGTGTGADGVVYERFREWKRSLL